MRKKSGETPLHKAVEEGNLESIRALIEAGADVHAKDEDGQTPLHQRGNAEAVRVLIAAGADVHAKDNEGRTPLNQEDWLNCAETIRVLIEAGADVHTKDNEAERLYTRRTKRNLYVF